MLDLVLAIIFNFIIVGFLACAVHLFGHWITAVALGYKINFISTYGHIKNTPIAIPRFIYEIPTLINQDDKKIIQLAGFAFEFMFALFLLFNIGFFFYYLIFVILHLMAYQSYADSNHNDFNIFC